MWRRLVSSLCSTNQRVPFCPGFIGVYSRILWGGARGESPPPPKKLTVSPPRALNLFFQPGQRVTQIYHGGFFRMDNKHTGNYSSLLQSKGCRFIRKMYENTFWDPRAPPGPYGGAHELVRSPRPSSRNGELLLRGRREEERGEGRGLLIRGGSIFRF